MAHRLVIPPAVGVLDPNSFPGTTLAIGPFTLRETEYTDEIDWMD